MHSAFKQQLTKSTFLNEKILKLGLLKCCSIQCSFHRQIFIKTQPSLKYKRFISVQRETEKSLPYLQVMLIFALAIQKPIFNHYIIAKNNLSSEQPADKREPFGALQLSGQSPGKSIFEPPPSAKMLFQQIFKFIRSLWPGLVERFFRSLMDLETRVLNIEHLRLGLSFFINSCQTIDGTLYFILHCRERGKSGLTADCGAPSLRIYLYGGLSGYKCNSRIFCGYRTGLRVVVVNLLTNYCA